MQLIAFALPGALLMLSSVSMQCPHDARTIAASLNEGCKSVPALVQTTRSNYVLRLAAAAIYIVDFRATSAKALDAVTTALLGVEAASASTFADHARLKSNSVMGQSVIFTATAGEPRRDISSDNAGGPIVVDPVRITPDTMANAGSTLTMNGSTFSVGVQQSFSSLAPVSSLSKVSGVSFNSQYHTITITANNLNLSGIDFQGWSVTIRANNVTINNSLFDNSGYYAVYQVNGFNGLTLENSTFIGDKTANGNLDFVFSEGVADIHNNVFINASCSAVWITGGTVANNYIGGGGFDPTAHSDGIYQAFSMGPLTIQNNYINWNTPPDAAVGSNNAIVLISEGGPINNTTITGNVILGGGYTILIRNSDYSGHLQPVLNVTVSNNQIGNWGWGPLNTNLGYPPPAASINWTRNTGLR